MPSATENIRHVFGGGWATDFGVVANLSVGREGTVVVPFLTRADNLFYQLDGGPHKIGGDAKVNSVTIDSGAEINGLYDFWRQNAGSPAQSRVVHAGTKIFADGGSGTFVQKATGLVDGAIPNYSTFDDLLIIASNSAADVPRKFDGSNITVLGTNTPNFGFSVTHKNRTWAAGVIAADSTLYYGPIEDPDGDWSADGGSIVINPGDGDRITGLASWKDELWVFKGPYKGSIHRITGSSPTGSDSFARRDFIAGIGAVNQNSIFDFRDDIGFMWSDGTVRSLRNTAAFGDAILGTLSLPINIGFLGDRVNHTYLDNAWAVDHPCRGMVYFTLPVDSSTTNNLMIAMDYRFDTPRWSGPWDAYNSRCIAMVRSGGDCVPMAGGDDGFVRQIMTNSRVLEDSEKGINMYAETPYLSHGDPMTYKTLTRAAVGIDVKGRYDLTFKWMGEDKPTGSATVSQGSGDALGQTFVLGTSKLAGARFSYRFMTLHDGGEFRTVRIGIGNANYGEDLELHEFLLTMKRSRESVEN